MSVCLRIVLALLIICKPKEICLHNSSVLACAHNSCDLEHAQQTYTHTHTPHTLQSYPPPPPSTSGGKELLDTIKVPRGNFAAVKNRLPPANYATDMLAPPGAGKAGKGFGELCVCL